MPFNPDQPAYRRLRTISAERRKPIAVWTGAGLSTPAGLPTWKQLRSALVDAALHEVEEIVTPEGDRKEDAIRRAANIDDLWESMDIIKKAISETTFRESIRSLLTIDQKIEIPPVYRKIWQLPSVGAAITLNIDDLISRAHRRVRVEEDAANFTGWQAHEYAHVINARRPFIAYLHGLYDAYSTWVMTKTDVQNLFAKPGFRDVVGFIFANYVVVFVGISADDSAASGVLRGLSGYGIDMGQHFWITDRRDPATREWANGVGIQTITYRTEVAGSHGDAHSPALIEIFDDMLRYVSRDMPAPVIFPPGDAIPSLPPTRELRAMEDDQLRHLLSGRAKTIIEAHDGLTENEEYEQFLKVYSSNIHQAWHVTDSEPENRFYNYFVDKRIHASAFSNVWKLRDESGNFYALKVMQMENIKSGPQIESFRRGVQSLGFLTRATVPGTASLVAAYEIPTAVIMRFIEGNPLQDVAQWANFDRWIDGLNILSRVGRHLHYSHNLPQGVLHRDVRPSNIMLPNFVAANHNNSAGKWDVVVLNYDMSWHTAARGGEIKGNVTEVGYYAPEHLSGDRQKARELAREIRTVR